MNSFFKNLAIALTAATAFAFAAPAMADSSCTGCTPTTPMVSPTGFNFTIGTGVAFGGNGFGSFGNADGNTDGITGNVEIVKNGFGQTMSEFTAGGNMCGAVDCNTAAFTASGSAGEQIGVTAWAKGNNIWVTNGGNAATLLQMNISKTVVPAATGQ